jgi:hypothetical protein
MKNVELLQKCLRDVLETVNNNAGLIFEHQTKGYTLLDGYNADMLYETFEYAHKNGLFVASSEMIAAIDTGKGLSVKGHEDLKALKNMNL